MLKRGFLQNAQQASEPGNKFDKGKLRMDLIPICVEEALARALTYGAKEYGDRNWEQGFSWSRAYGALRRHLAAFWARQDKDEESSLHHLDLALAELAFLRTFAHFDAYREFDDRPNGRIFNARLEE